MPGSSICGRFHRSADNDFQTKPIEVEGPVQWIKYDLNEGTTPPSGLQIMRNFENAVKKAGGTIEGQYPGCARPSTTPSACRHGQRMHELRPHHEVRKGRQEIWAFLQADGGGANYLLTISEREAMKQEISVTELVDKLSKDGFITL